MFNTKKVGTMKILHDIQNKIATAEGYKHQFIVNDKQNLLIVDPIMSIHDYYTMIFPALSLHSSELCNIAFTNILKYEDLENRRVTELSDTDVIWANTIVFPFTLDSLQYYDNQHLFAAIRKLNPEIKIITVVQDAYFSPLFTKRLLKSFQEKQTHTAIAEITAQITKNINSSIVNADKVIVHGEALKTALTDYLKSKKIKKKPIEIMPLFQSYSVISEGMDPEKRKNKFRDPKFINVLIDIDEDYKNVKSFLSTVVDPAKPHIRFYTYHPSIKHKKVNNLKTASLTKWYTDLFQNCFDYTVYLAEVNDFTRSTFYFGSIIDTSMMGAIPIFLNKNFHESNINPIDSSELTTLMDSKSFLEKINENIFDNRVKEYKMVFEATEEFSIDKDRCEQYFKVFFE